MKINSRYLTGGLTAAALVAVVTGTAVAQSNTSTPADTVVSDTGSAPEDQTDDVDEEDDDDAPLNGSITVADDESLSEADEAAQLAQLPGLISEADAIAAATADGGAADTASLENENGSVVFEVEVTAADGTVEEVKVDAGNGDVLEREIEDADDDSDESDDDSDESDDDDSDESDDDDEVSEGDESADTTTP